jgi:hypothetical protein
MSTLQVANIHFESTANNRIQYEGANGYTLYAPSGIKTSMFGSDAGIVTGELIYSLNTNLAGTNATGAQNLLGRGVTVSSNTAYVFDAMFTIIKTAGTTNHSISLGFGGTATLNSIQYMGAFDFVADATGGLVTASAMYFTFMRSAALTTASGSGATANLYYAGWLHGMIFVNAGGTFIPQYSLSSAPGGAYTTQAGSYFKMYPVGAGNANVSIGTWA